MIKTIARCWNTPLPLALILVMTITGCRPTAPTTTKPAPSLGSLCQELLAAHNAERAKVGLPPLALNGPLTIAAQKHADWMAHEDKLSHTGEDGTDFMQRIGREGYSAITGAENIAQGQRNVTEVVTDWMASSGHRANILKPFKDVGFGVSGQFWCADFGTERQREAWPPPNSKTR